MAVAVILILVAVGSVLFHLLSPWWWTPIASNWSYIDDTISLTFWITGVVFTAVILFMAYCVFRFRHQRGPTGRVRAGEHAAGVVAHHRHRGGRRGHAGSRPVRVAAVRHRPGGGVRVRGRGSAVAVELPAARARTAGLGASDTAQRRSGQSAGTESRRSQRPGRCRHRGRRPAPAGRASRSRCCFARSMSCTISTCPSSGPRWTWCPGMVTYFWLTPTRTGTFEILCFELCGLGHPDMRGIVVVDEESDYQAWLQEQPTFAQLAAMRRDRRARRGPPRAGSRCDRRVGDRTRWGCRLD